MMVGTGSKEQSATAIRNNDMWNQDGGGETWNKEGEVANNFKAIGVKQTEP